ncbi:hypothetical protein [Curtobacterium poinsettiae]|uniref:hypothetical protein n=1 Tax=Curtobacterium poinsettiae TaxID=159612 RepID=UPI00217D01E0|nr:hypothetical protein [Curtobacterium flaccumfaciens]MCS6578227.1 hypothetical protein [Curtobacterium flaccumfaciens]
MTTTTRRPTSSAHADEAARLLGLVNTSSLNALDFNEYTAVYARDPQAVAAVASAHIALAQLEEQRTANLVAAYNGDLLKNPHPVGTHEHDVWWAKTAGDLTERVGVQR